MRRQVMTRRYPTIEMSFTSSLPGPGMFVRAEERYPFADGVLSLAGEERVAVRTGDALFVPAGTEHRFEATSPDFGAWMIFYGPEGGER